MATALEITSAFLDTIQAKLVDTVSPPTADETSNLLNQYQTLTQLIRDGYQWTSEDLEDLPATLRAELDVWKNGFTETGFWNPTIGGEDGGFMTLGSVSSAFYHRIDNQVTVTALITGIVTNPLTLSNRIIIGGLPFPSKTYSDTSNIKYCNLFDNAVSSHINCYCVSNYVRLFFGSTIVSVLPSHVLDISNGTILITITYRTI